MRKERKILDYETMLYESEEIMKFTHNSSSSSNSVAGVAVKGKMMNGEIVYKSS